MINAMTVDVEDFYHVSAFAGVIRMSDWPQYESRVERNTEKLLALFAERNILATFFVLGWVAERNPELIRRIHVAGHEVACHGYSHQLVYKQSQAVFREETARSKALLEDLIGAEVCGYRAASYSITAESIWALDILAELGFKYDSSIFPIKHDRYGMSDAPKEIHWRELAEGRRILEYPLSTWSLRFYDLPVAGGGYFRLFPYALTQCGLSSINRSGKPFIFYLHPWEVDPDQPRVAGASALSNFRHYNNLNKCFPRLQRLTNDFSFGTVRQSIAASGFEL